MNEQGTPKGVVLYYSFYPDIFSKLDDHQRSLILEAIFSTGGVCPMPELDEMTDLIWGLLSRILEINGERYQQAVQAGKKSAKTRAEQREQERQELIDRANADEQARDDLTHSTPLNDNGDCDLTHLTPLNDNGECDLTHLTHKDKDKDKDKDEDNDNDNDNDKDKDEMITNAQSADADEGSLSAACSADAEPKREKSSAKKQSVSKKMEEHFRELWLLYPLKRGKNQVKAAAKRRLADVSAAEMARAIDRYEREYENAPPDRQMLYGSTWFNGRWEDYSDANYTPAPAKPAQKSARAQQAQFRSAEEESKQADYWASREE